MGVDGRTGGARDVHRAPQPAGQRPIGRVPATAGVATIVGSAFVTAVTWPDW